MEDFFKKMQQEIDKGIAFAGVKSKDLFGSAKLWTEIWSLREDQRRAFETIGRTVYRMSQNPGFDGAAKIREECRQVAGCEAEIQAKEAGLQKIRNQK